MVTDEDRNEVGTRVVACLRMPKNAETLVPVNRVSDGHRVTRRRPQVPVARLPIAVAAGAWARVALFLPFARNKGRQGAAKSDTKRRAEIARFCRPRCAVRQAPAKGGKEWLTPSFPTTNQEVAGSSPAGRANSPKNNRLREPFAKFVLSRYFWP